MSHTTNDSFHKGNQIFKKNVIRNGCHLFLNVIS